MSVENGLIASNIWIGGICLCEWITCCDVYDAWCQCLASDDGAVCFVSVLLSF